MAVLFNTKTYDLIVIGSGAAGMIAAGRAAELGGKVLLIEKMHAPGRKLAITGKGRCNVSNAGDYAEYFKNIFPNGKLLKHALGCFFYSDIVALLNNNGVALTIERGKRIFPSSNKAEDIVTAFKKWLSDFSIDYCFNTRVKEIRVKDRKVYGVKVNKENYLHELHATNVILCTGGKSYPATGSTGDGYVLASETGHSVIEPRPALVPLVTTEKISPGLKGLNLKHVKAVLWVNDKKIREEFGEVYYTSYGLSGPVILTLSRWVVEALFKKDKVVIRIDLKPALDENKLDARLLRDLNALGNKQLENVCKEWLPLQLIPEILSRTKIDGKKHAHQVTSKERKQIMHTLKNLQYTICDHRGFKEAIITTGGIDTAEVNTKTMESRIIKNLYFAGEVLDLDGNTGGFNLQLAFSTGWLAAQSAMK